MDKEKRDAAIFYVTHASTSKEEEFIQAELAEQVQAGHLAISPLEAVTSFQNLKISPVEVIP